MAAAALRFCTHVYISRFYCAFLHFTIKFCIFLFPSTVPYCTCINVNQKCAYFMIIESVDKVIIHIAADVSCVDMIK